MSQRIGKYELLDKIAEGGFGVVFKGRDPFIKRLVAIKTCPLDDEDLRLRFFREAEIAGAFDHPNVTIVHDFGVEKQTAFLVQEYLSGEDLSAKIRRRDSLSLAVMLDYLVQIARGLAYAHGKGVIHRDIKPANVRILEGGQVKIMDFGIAKLTTSSTRLTRQGMAVGTVGYLAPEQLADEPLDHRTDLFAYGVLAYELFSGFRPFEGRDLTSVMRAILETEPQPLSERVDDVPPALEDLIHRCLAKRREQRPSGFEVVIEELEALQRQEEPASALLGDGRTMILTAPPATYAPPVASISPPGTVPVPGARREPELAGHGAGDADVGRDTQQVEVPVTPKGAPGAEPAAGPGEVLPEVDEALSPPAAAPESAAASAPEHRPQPSPGPAPLPTTAPGPAPGQDARLTPLEPPSPAGPHEAPAVVSPASTTESPRSRGLGIPLWALGVTAALVAMVILATAGWFLFRWATTDALQPPEASAPRTVAPTPAAPVAPPGQGVVTVVAAPWGEIHSAADAEGNELSLPGDRVTPAVLRLPPGAYRLVLANPEALEMEECTVEVAADQAALCRVEFPRPDAIEYFRETGWWQ